jgi:hypothetical protein
MAGKAPESFRAFSENFGRRIETENLGLNAPDGLRWSQLLGEYISQLTAQLYNYSLGLQGDRNIEPPAIPYN